MIMYLTNFLKCIKYDVNFINTVIVIYYENFQSSILKKSYIINFSN